MTHDPDQGQYFSFNTSPPLLLQIHRETREFALRTYKQCFGTDSPSSKKVWIDFARDTILLNDDYLEPEIEFPQLEESIDSLDVNLGAFEPELVQNLAISADHFRHRDRADRSRALQFIVESLLDRCTAVKRLYIVCEDGVNPYSRGRIRFFPMERTCLSTCCSKGCIHLAMITAKCKDSINNLRASTAVLARRIDVRFVGAWRGGSRAEFGHALDGYEDESGDEYHDPEDDPENGYESDTMETPDEKRGRVEFGSSLIYDEADEGATFSDHEGISPRPREDITSTIRLSSLLHFLQILI